MIGVEVIGLSAVIRGLENYVKDIDRAIDRWGYRVGTKIVPTAQKYCPKSPTRSESGAKARKGARKARATSRSTPGALQNSITYKQGKDYVDILVPVNSAGGGYAVKIHDEKGHSWHNRGKGTQAKGAQADDKFIKRAVDFHDKNGDIKQILRDEIRKARR